MQLRLECPSRSPNFTLRTPRLHSGTACDRSETTEKPELPPVLEAAWQEPSETSTKQCNLNINNNDSTIQYTPETIKTTVASPTSSPKGTQPQSYVDATEHPQGNQTGNEPVPFANCSENCPTDTQISEQHVTTALTGNTTFPPESCSDRFFGWIRGRAKVSSVIDCLRERAWEGVIDGGIP